MTEQGGAPAAGASRGASAPTAVADPSRRIPARERGLAWLRGEPLHVPSHALVIHFPAALLPTSLAFDVIGRVDPALTLGSAAALLLLLGLAGGLAAVATGLLDRVQMLPGARRARVTRHMIVQLAALAAFAVSLVLRAGDAGAAAPLASLVASIVGLGLLLVGNHLGGLLVYRDGMRVRAGRG